jgi:hypothetical protein
VRLAIFGRKAIAMAGGRGGNVFTAGRVVINDTGILQARLWGLFGRHFKLSWSDIVSWNAKDQVVINRLTGEERVISHGLTIFHERGFQIISRRAGHKQFPLIVDKVRQRVPDKENFPVAVDPLEIMNYLQLRAAARSADR